MDGNSNSDNNDDDDVDDDDCDVDAFYHKKSSAAQVRSGKAGDAEVKMSPTPPFKNSTGMHTN